MKKHFLITAGPTHEPLDPVRYLTNRSSGKMGYALAGAAAHEGHRVTLISGPCELDVPTGVDFIPVETAAEMYEAVKRYIGKSDIAIFAAAVADYRPAHVPDQKIKKTGDTLTIEFIKNPDILGSAREVFGYQGTLIGFAAETENVEKNARVKLQKKGCDFVVANDVSRKDIGFDSSENEVALIFAEHTEPLPKADKYQLSLDIIERALAI
ncbi:phosphopantothenoylcysteine decarboxylase [Rubritalea spongiae]|uniref:Phosphopantothenoylcysteine decarboxylase n=1 Tax=Rubritalea spongiae TaxID=430797 RepID=A0ABW5EBC9_9BACT